MKKLKIKKQNTAYVDVGTHVVEDHTYMSKKEFVAMLKGSGSKLVKWVSENYIPENPKHRIYE